MDTGIGVCLCLRKSFQALYPEAVLAWQVRMLFQVAAESQPAIILNDELSQPVRGCLPRRPGQQRGAGRDGVQGRAGSAL